MEKETTLFELPNGWVWTKLADITLAITRTSRTSEDSNEEFRYIDVEAIDNNSQTIKEIKTYTWGNAPSFFDGWYISHHCKPLRPVVRCPHRARSPLRILH